MQKFKTIIYGSPLIIAGIYLLFSGVWIAYSDQWVLTYFDDPQQITAIQTYKGWFFITVSAVVIYLLILTSNKNFYSLFNKNVDTQKAFEATFEQAAVGIIHHDKNYRWLRVNKRMCEMLGYEKHEFFEIPLDKLIHPNDFEHGKELDNQLINGKKRTYQIEKRYRRKDGTLLDAWLSKSVVWDKDGQNMFFVAVIEDITRRKDAERNLERSYQLAQIGSWKIDLQSTKLFWSADVKKIHEVDQNYESDMESSIAFFKEGENRKKFKNALHKAITDGTPFDLELQIVTATGKQRWVRVISESEFLDGKAITVFGSMQNIDERKKAEIKYQALYKREKKERLRIEQINSRLKLLDQVGNLFVESESGYETVLTKSARLIVEEIADICSIDIVEKGGMKRVIQVVKDPQKEGIIQEINNIYPGFFYDNDLVQNIIRTGEQLLINNFTEKELRSLVKDEEQFKLVNRLGIRSMFILPLKAKEKVLGMITLEVLVNGREFGKDDYSFLSELADKIALHIDNILMSRELREFNRSLESIVAERTSQLEQTNEELESFSYSVSHDLRSPLRAISGYTNLLTEDYHQKLDPQGQEFLSVIKSEVKRMDELIDDLLAFSRLSRTGKTEREFEMRSLIQNCIKEVLQAGTNTEPAIKIKKIYNAWGDPKLIRQVWTNLISNAVKYRKKGQNPDIVIDSRMDDRSDQIIYSVRDNGVGFNMKYADKLFGVFQRLHSDDEFEGSGIGLALVKRIVNRHGGNVWAESEIQNGSTFYFSLPIKKQ